MGYYPLYFPESYRVAMNMIPPVQSKVPKVQPVIKKEVNSPVKRYVQWPEKIKYHTGKGLYFDQYA